MHKRLNSEAETIDFAKKIALRIKPGDTLAISGELGAGKSVLARALMRALGVSDAALPSPTYTIIQEYEGRGCRIAHMDWYRLEGEEELDAIGVREYFSTPWITLIEWPERGAGLVEHAIRISLACTPDDPDTRLLDIEGLTPDT